MMLFGVVIGGIQGRVSSSGKRPIWESEKLNWSMGTSLPGSVPHEPSCERERVGQALGPSSPDSVEVLALTQ